MVRVFAFCQIVLAALVGSLASDALQQYAKQCVSKDSKGCAETRVDCIWNSSRTPSIIHLCLTEKEL